MKKKVSILLIIIMINTVVGCNFISASENDVDITYEISGSDSMLKVKDVLTKLGYDVNWESTSKTLYASKSKDIFSIQANSDIAKLNGEVIKMNKSAQLVDGSIYVSVASLCKLTDEKINDDGTINIEETISDDDWKENKFNVDLSQIKDDKYQITEEGIYTLNGEYTGEIHINCDSKVKLVLNNVTIKNENGPAIYFENSKKGIIELADNSTNILSDGTDYEDAKGCVFSNDDIDIQGNGLLTVNANYKHGIVSDDDIDIKEGTLNITTSVGDGIKANGAVKIKSGNITLNTMKDGIKGDECVVIDSGNVNITTNGDIPVSNEQFDFGRIGSGRPSMENEEDRLEPPMDNEQQNMPKFDFNNMDTTSKNIKNELKEDTVNNIEQNTETTTSSISSKGINSNGNITINGGTIDISSTDHGIKSDNIIVINSGDINIKSTISKGIKCNGNIFINGGNIKAYTKDESIETKKTLTINNGIIDLKSDDDAINAGGGSGKNVMRDASDGDEHQIVINGGKITVDSKGDGLDSNGNLYFYGGDVFVNGPTNGGNGALDSTNINAFYSGDLLAIGSMGMAECPSPASGKNAFNIALDDVQATQSAILIMDSKNNTIYDTVSNKEFQSIVFASDKIKEGEKYYIYINGNKTVELTAEKGITKYGNMQNQRGMGNRPQIGNRENRNKELFN